MKIAFVSMPFAGLGNIPEFALAGGGDVQWSKGLVRGPRQLPLVIGSTKS
jgi:hypothetical protein